METKKQGEIQLPTKIANAIRDKRRIDCQVSKKLATLQELDEAKTKVKIAISEEKKNSHSKFIKSEMNFLKDQNSKKAWRWIFQHSKYTTRCATNINIYSPTTKIVETNSTKCMEIWSNHFAELCKKPKDAPEGENYLEGNNKFQQITDQPILWQELRSTL